MKKLFALLLALCMLLGAAAVAQERTAASCGIEGHYKDDGLDHYRARPCWVYGHTNCDGGDHGRAECKIHGHFACDGEDHFAAPCGAPEHFVCDYRDSHETAACGVAGHCVSDGRKHTNASCGLSGHYRCDQMSHYLADCNIAGHYDCDGMEHTRAVCGKKGHTNCDGLEHEAAPCGRYGHCTSDGLTHGPAACGIPGHYDCDGKNHDVAACGVEGHYACAGGRHYAKPISEYCNASPQHVPCQGNPEHFCDPNYGGCGEMYLCSRSNAHTACRMCGLLWCDRSLGGHETPCKKAAPSATVSITATTSAWIPVRSAAIRSSMTDRTMRHAICTMPASREHSIMVISAARAEAITCATPTASAAARNDGISIRNS